jgi:hypothetical protein
LDWILQIIHSDLAGPMQQRSIQGTLYIATFIDDYSRNGVVYFLKSKDQTAAAFRKFLAWAETQTLERLRALHSDRGGEYISKALKSILDEKGIDHKLTMLGSPQQNGLAERWNRTLLNKAHAMLHGAGLSLGFWELAIDTAVHIHNRTPSHTIGWCTPHELWNAGHIPDVSYFHIFGCKAYVHVPEDKRQKLDPRSIKMTLVGYEPGFKGYRSWNSNTQAIVLSHNVTFDERSFPFRESGPQSTPPVQPDVPQGPVTIQLPEIVEAPPPAPAPTMPEPVHRDNTVFFMPSSQPPTLPPPAHPCPVQVNTGIPGPSFGPCPPSLW